jgi:hypothetical protein
MKSQDAPNSSYRPRKSLEFSASEPIALFVSGSLPEDIKPAFSEYQREQNEKSNSEVIIDCYSWK